jgi:hypothetical protein
MREREQQKEDYAIQKASCFGTVGMIVVVAFLISPELGLLALGGVMLLRIISRHSWVLPRRKK